MPTGALGLSLIIILIRNLWVNSKVFLQPLLSGQSLRLFHWPFLLPGTFFPVPGLAPSLLNLGFCFQVTSAEKPSLNISSKISPLPTLTLLNPLSQFSSFHFSLPEILHVLGYFLSAPPSGCKFPLTGTCVGQAWNRHSVDVWWMDEWIGPKQQTGYHSLLRWVTERARRVLTHSKKKCEVLFLPYFCPNMLRLTWLMNQFLKTHNGVSQLSWSNQHCV